MAEPSATKMPTAYDDDTILTGDQIDQRFFELASTINSTVQTISTTGNLGDITPPVYILFKDGTDEIVFAEGVSGTDFTNCTRGARGTTSASHTAGAGISLILSGNQMNMYREAVIAGEKFQGLVGLDASKPATPVVNQVYFATDTKKLYVCVAAGQWEWSGNRDDHADLNDLTTSDDHTQYHNDTRAQTWHDGLSGGHVTGGDTHDHGVSTALGAGRVQSGVSSSRSSIPTYEREIYYETDTDLLYISKGTSSSADWVKIVGAPVGTIVAFTETDLTNEYSGSCPPGWSRYTAGDGKLLKGAPTGVTSPLNSGGSSTHTHTYTSVVSHSHVVSTQTASFSTTTTHTHGVYVSGSGGPGGLARATNQLPRNENSSSSGDHTHTFDVDAHSSTSTKRTSDNSAGVTTGTTGTASNWPSYQEIVWCIKD